MQATGMRGKVKVGAVLSHHGLHALPRLQVGLTAARQANRHIEELADVKDEAAAEEGKVEWPISGWVSPTHSFEEGVELAADDIGIILALCQSRKWAQQKSREKAPADNSHGAREGTTRQMHTRDH